jgi:hypothetical protein
MTTDRMEFESGVRAFLNALVPGSPFLMALMENSTGYDVHGRWYPSVTLTPRFLDDLLARLPVRGSSVLRTDNSVSPVRSGYDAMLLVTGFTAA